MISGAISTFKTHDCVVTRTLVGTHTDGKYTLGSSSSFSVEACIQPLSARQLKALPEGQKTEETRAMYCRTEIKGRTSSTEPDVVSFDGEDWLVFSVEKWVYFDSFYIAILMKRGTQ